METLVGWATFITAFSASLAAVSTYLSMKATESIRDIEKKRSSKEGISIGYSRKKKNKNYSPNIHYVGEIFVDGLSPTRIERAYLSNENDKEEYEVIISSPGFQIGNGTMLKQGDVVTLNIEDESSVKDANAIQWKEYFLHIKLINVRREIIFRFKNLHYENLQE